MIINNNMRPLFRNTSILSDLVRAYGHSHHGKVILRGTWLYCDLDEDLSELGGLAEYRVDGPASHRKRSGGVIRGGQ